METEIMKINIQQQGTRFPSYDPYAKQEYVDRIAKDLLDALIAAGAKFYTYCGQEIMYLNRWMTDIFRKAELVRALDWHLGVRGLPYALDVAISLRQQARPLYEPIPEGVLGTISGVKEPKLKIPLWKKISDLFKNR